MLPKSSPWCSGGLWGVCWLHLPVPRALARPLAMMTSSLPLAVPVLVATSIQCCFWLFFLNFTRNAASSSLVCPAKRLMSCNREATYYNTSVPLLPLMKYCWLSEMKNPVRHFYFSFSYLFFTLQVPSDSSSLTFNLHPFAAEEKIISVFSVCQVPLDHGTNQFMGSFS